MGNSFSCILSHELDQKNPKNFQWFLDITILFYFETRKENYFTVRA